MIMNDVMSFKDGTEKHGLRGIVEISRQNKTTGEIEFLERKSNIIPISGFQWILMKMFGLYLDSKHNVPGKRNEVLGKDTTVVIPDMNAKAPFHIGVNPDSYSPMNTNISDTHFIQGFMIGNGGSGEDAITTKNTNYSFISLRNPIPFQQTQGTTLDPSLAGKYLGIQREANQSSFSNSYYIKKFDETPHIYHSWWREGQHWDYLDPVTVGDLGPNALNGIGKTDRIETYAECKLSIDKDDCVAYFSHEGNTQTAMINELGLVAFDTAPGIRSIVEALYADQIKSFIKIVFDNNRTEEDVETAVTLAKDIFTVMENLRAYNHPNINAFIDVIEAFSSYDETPTAEQIEAMQDELKKDENIGVEAFYNQNGMYVYEQDKFLDYMSASNFSTLSTDEAQRIKLITYYTFNSIPLQDNWRILINYRIYAN